MRPRTFVMSVVLLLAPTAVFRAAERDEGQGAASVGALVRQLGDDCYSRREAATRALDAIGEPALGALRQAAGSADPEVRRRGRAERSSCCWSRSADPGPGTRWSNRRAGYARARA